MESSDASDKPVPPIQRRFQFSVAELLTVAICCGALGTFYFLYFDEIEDKMLVGRLIGERIAEFLVGCLVVALMFRGRLRAIGAVALLIVVAASGEMSRRELLYRQMVINETAAITACKAFCTAEDVFRRTDWNNDGYLEYAQSLSELYDAKGSIYKRFADADDRGGHGQPNNGYLFRILKSQSGSAPGGKRTYLASGRLALGYALIAYPAKWGVTGRNTFSVSNAGTIYEKDLGENTLDLTRKIVEFNPDMIWCGDCE